MAVRIQSLLNIEESLTRVMVGPWLRAVRPRLQRARGLVRRDRFDEAAQVLDDLDSEDLLRPLEGPAMVLAQAAYIFGQSLARGGEVRAPQDLPLQVEAAPMAMMRALQRDLVAGAKRRLAEAVQDAQREAEGQVVQRAEGPDLAVLVRRYKAVIPGLAGQLNSAVATGGAVNLSKGANLTTTRLAAFGAATELGAQGKRTYQVSEVLDDRTCPVCIRMHGRVFQVGPTAERLEAELLEPDPAVLAVSAPFPRSSRAGIEELTSLNSQGLQDRGWTYPPFHPWCRGVLVPRGTVPPSERVPFRPLPPGPTRPPPATPARQVAAPPAANPQARPPEAYLDEALAADPAAAKSTSELYQESSGAWTAQRRELHDSIVDDFLAEGRAVAAGEQPTFQMLGGGTASGKSSAVRSGQVKLPGRSVVVDADAIKAKLPEYNAMLAAGDTRAAAFVHEESSALSNVVMGRGAAMRTNLVLDGTGDGGIEKLRKRIGVFRSQGYRVKADYVSVPTDVAKARALARAQKTGRYVPDEVIESIHASVSRDMAQGLKEGLFDELRLFDNSGSSPVLILEHVNGTTRVVDARLWRDFLAKGGLTPEGVGILPEALAARALPPTAELVTAEKVLDPSAAAFLRVSEARLERAVGSAARPGVIDTAKLRPSRISAKFSELHDEAVDAYKSSSYRTINSALRQGEAHRPIPLGDLASRRIGGGPNGTGTVPRVVSLLDEAIARSPALGEDAPILWRGISGDFAKEVRRSLNVGDVIQDPSYGSWSAVRQVAQEFAGSQRTSGVLFRLQLPPTEKVLITSDANTRGLRATARGSRVNTTEAEVILARGKRYRVVQVEKNVKLPIKGRTDTPKLDVYTLEIEE